jgi:ATP-dependent Lon protease
MSNKSSTKNERKDHDEAIQRGFVVRRGNGQAILVPQSFVYAETAEKEAAKRLLEPDRNATEKPDVNTPLLQVMVDLAEKNKADADARAAAVKADTEAAVQRLKQQQGRGSRLIKVFSEAEISSGMGRAKTADSDRKAALKAAFERAGAANGLREVPKFKNIGKVVKDLHAKFPNFASAIDGLAQDLALASAGSATHFRVDPSLLDGAPGIGKTMFASSLAEMLGVPFLKVSAGGFQHAAQLCGTASHWANSRPGQIFDLLAGGDSAVCIVLIDEVDKISDRSECSVLPVLLELLEAGSASKFKDESLGLKMDASRLIVLLTSNNLEQIDKALLSRCNVHKIKSPDSKQRLEIASQLHAALKKRTGRKIEMDAGAVQEMAEAVSDLRVLTRTVKAAFSQALIAGSKVARPTWASAKGRARIGF